MSAGGVKVAIYSSDPDLGDPAEFVFYLQPPYSPEALDKKRREMTKKWVEVKQSHGYELRSTIRFRGPVPWLHEERLDDDPAHLGDDEFQLQAYFRRESPLIVGTDVIDLWAQARRETGHPVYDPIKGNPVSRGMRQTRAAFLPPRKDVA